MSFEDIPEDRCESFPCGGSIEQNKDNKWQCNECQQVYGDDED